MSVRYDFKSKSDISKSEETIVIVADDGLNVAKWKNF